MKIQIDVDEEQLKQLNILLDNINDCEPADVLCDVIDQIGKAFNKQK